MNFNYPFFEPHVGKLIGTNKCVFNKHILVLGDSHHCGECSIEECKSHMNNDCKYLTIDVINGHIAGKDDPNNSLYEFDNLFSNISRENLWESITFYNYLQWAEPLSNTDSKSYDDDYSVNSFWSVLERIRPDAMIVWGTRKDNKGLYECLPGNFENGPWVKCTSIKVHEEVIQISGIKLRCGKLIKVLPIHHPSYSKRYHETTNLRDIILAFLEII